MKPLLLLMLIALSMVNGSMIYRVYTDGTVLVTTTINTEGKLSIDIPVDGEVVEESILVFDDQGRPIPYNFNGTHITVYALNASKTTVLYMSLNLLNVSRRIWHLNVSPFLPSTIILPENSSILSLTGKAMIYAEDNKLVIKYDEPGQYSIKFTIRVIAVPLSPTPITPMPTLTTPTTTTPTSTPTTPTTTPTSPSPATPTSPLTTPTTTPITTPTTPTTTPTTSTLITTPVTPAPGITLPMEYIAAIIAAVIIIIAIAIIKRSMSVSVKVVTSMLDERDKQILSVLKTKGSLALSELSKETDIPKSTLWRRIKKLEKLGYISIKNISGKLIIELKKSST